MCIRDRFVSISQVIGCEDRLRNDLYCVEWGVKLYSNYEVHLPPKGNESVRILLAQCWFAAVAISSAKV